MSKFRNSIVYLGYEDVFIFPNGSSVSSRKDVDTTTVLHGSNSHIQVVLEVPVISANMDTVTEDKMAIAMRNSGGIGALHRFMSIEENVEMYKRVKDGIDKSKNIEAGHECFVSIGVNPSDYMERTRRLYAAGARLFVIDIAHGHSDHMRNTIKWLRKEFKNEIFIMAGNVATPEGVSELDQAGADCVKIGVGPGCFAAGTRILMANGTYKNIEKITKGEFVINKNGKSVKVLKAFSTGIRKVVKVKTNHFYKPTLVTPDHQYWVGDLSSTSKKTIASAGYSNLLDKKAKSIPKASKYKWCEIGSDKNFVSLMPRNIEFEMPTTFNIELKKKGAEGSEILTPSYELGYVFGTFLGDGHARTPRR